MATRRRTKINPYLWYALYGAVGYYGYRWWSQRAQKQSTVVSVPPGTTT